MKSVAFCIGSNSLLADPANHHVISPALMPSILKICFQHSDLKKVILLPFDRIKVGEDGQLPAMNGKEKALQKLQKDLQALFFKRNITVECHPNLNFDREIPRVDLLAHEVTLAYTLMHLGLEVDEFNFFVASIGSFKELRSVFLEQSESATLILDDVVARFHLCIAGELIGRGFFQIGVGSDAIPEAKGDYDTDHLSDVRNFLRRHSIFYYPNPNKPKDENSIDLKQSLSKSPFK